MGAVGILAALVAPLRAAWPGIRILVRADNGLVEPALLQYCEDEHLDYAFGYATTAVLERRTAQIYDYMDVYYRCYDRRGPHAQRFDEVLH